MRHLQFSKKYKSVIPNGVFGVRVSHHARHQSHLFFISLPASLPLNFLIPYAASF